jgi:hypothetical protein
MAGISFQNMPIRLKHRLKRNPETEFYEIDEAGKTYCIPFELLITLKIFYNGYPRADLAGWYASLNNGERKQIKVSGRENDTGFQPDPIYESD